MTRIIVTGPASTISAQLAALAARAKRSTSLAIRAGLLPAIPTFSHV